MTNSTTFWLQLCNAFTALSWAYVVMVIVTGWNHVVDNHNNNDSTIWCQGQLSSAVRIALYISCLEFFNASMGITRSKPWQVLLFASVRLGVEVYVTPLVGCSHRTHLLTATCWALGDTIRFGCMLLPSDMYIAKWIRYNVGCFLFPIGAFGEMSMVYTSATIYQHFGLYFAAALWPVGFFPLYRQLLKQRQKFMKQTNTDYTREVKVA